jgi:hypothetical protein
MTDWDFLLDPDADKYVYRLHNENNLPVGILGPSVAFTLRQAKSYSLTNFIPKAHWVRAGELIYSVE